MGGDRIDVTGGDIVVDGEPVDDGGGAGVADESDGEDEDEDEEDAAPEATAVAGGVDNCNFLKFCLYSSIFSR